MKTASSKPVADSGGRASVRPPATPSVEGDEALAGAEERPPRSWRDHRIPLAVTLSVIVLDQLTKWWAIVRLKPEGWPHPVHPVPRVEILPGWLDFTYAENTGAAFSMFTGWPGALAMVSLTIAGVIFWWYWQTPREHRGTRIALALVLGGAIGNLIDRVLRQAVVDFIHVFWRDHHFPTFNVADSAICIGIALLILWSFREQKTR